MSNATLHKMSVELAAIYDEMCVIDKTPTNEQTLEQTDRLKFLLKHFVAGVAICKRLQYEQDHHRRFNMCKSELIDGSENIKLCLDCKFIHMGYDERLCYRDQTFKTNAVTGYKIFVSKEHDCFNEREQTPNIVIRLHRKITGHVPCGPEGKFWTKNIGSSAPGGLLV